MLNQVWKYNDSLNECVDLSYMSICMSMKAYESDTVSFFPSAARRFCHHTLRADGESKRHGIDVLRSEQNRLDQVCITCETCLYVYMCIN